MHVPMIVVHPAFTGGKRCAALTSHLDIAPTLLGLTGLPEDWRRAILGDRRGRDFSPLLAAPEHAELHAVRERSRRPSKIYVPTCPSAPRFGVSTMDATSSRATSLF